MLRGIFAFIAGSLLCAGCTTGPPTRAEMDTADYGPPPSEVDTRVKEHVRRRYPTAVTVEVGDPRRAWYGQEGGLFVLRDVRFGWAVPFRATTVGMTSIHAPLAQGRYFFRYDVMEGYSEGDRFIWTDG